MNADPNAQRSTALRLNLSQQRPKSKPTKRQRLIGSNSTSSKSKKNSVAEDTVPPSNRVEAGRVEEDNDSATISDYDNLLQLYHTWADPQLDEPPAYFFRPEYALFFCALDLVGYGKVVFSNMVKQIKAFKQTSRVLIECSELTEVLMADLGKLSFEMGTNYVKQAATAKPSVLSDPMAEQWKLTVCRFFEKRILPFLTRWIQFMNDNLESSEPKLQEDIQCIQNALAQLNQLSSPNVNLEEPLL